MESPITIANYFIQKGIKTHAPVSQMKVQKLIYFAHGWHLAATGQPLLSTGIEAWKFGPVVPEIHQELKQWGNQPITETINKPTIITDSELVEFLEFIWDIYGKYDAIYLSKLTHLEDSPWDQVASKFDYKLPNNLHLDDELIRTYFESLISNKSA